MNQCNESCKLIGCGNVKKGCSDMRQFQCPARKVIADRLVQFCTLGLEIAQGEFTKIELRESIKNLEQTLALLKQGDKEPGKLHHASGAGMSKDRLEEMKHDEERFIEREQEREFNERLEEE